MHDNKPYVLALESKSKTKEGNIGKSILSLKRSFRRVFDLFESLLGLVSGK